MWVSLPSGELNSYKFWKKLSLGLLSLIALGNLAKNVSWTSDLGRDKKAQLSS